MSQHSREGDNASFCRVEFLPDEKVVRVPAGISILDAATSAGIGIRASCGGHGTCGKCAVEIGPDHREVLACTHIIADDLEVHVPDKSRSAADQILAEGATEAVEPQPSYIKVHITPVAPTDEAILASLHAARQSHRFTIGLGSLPGPLPPEGLTVLCRYRSDSDDWIACDLEPGDTTQSLFGAAVDLGTTTVVLSLVDLTTGTIVAAAAGLNPQTTYGDDVVSRISYGDSTAGQETLRTTIVGHIASLLEKACTEAGVSASDVVEICVVGNTAMNHIFLGLPVKQLGQAPYKAWSVDAHDLPPEEVGLLMHPSGTVHAVENIAGFVGADTVAAALAVRIDRAQETTLLIDIGTNGELVLAAGGRIYAASCAAGPAFEGARISQGIRASAGAIERVRFDPKLQDIVVATIGAVPPVGICGSGLLDAVAVLIDLGVIDATGRMIEAPAASIPLPVAARITMRNDQPAFVLHPATDGSSAVLLTQKDVREVQLAKAAILAGIKLLQRKAGITDDDIAEFIVAGAFGNYIHPANAITIGLLPRIPLDRVRFVGNAAAAGARLILVNRHCRTLAAKLARSIEYVEIAHQADFTAVFSDCLLFME